MRLDDAAVCPREDRADEELDMPLTETVVQARAHISSDHGRRDERGGRGPSIGDPHIW